jgi:hypothetical protein
MLKIVVLKEHCKTVKNHIKLEKMACSKCGKKMLGKINKTTKNKIQKIISPSKRRYLQKELDVQMLLRIFRLKKCQQCKLYDSVKIHCSICECKDADTFDNLLKDQNYSCPGKIW